MTRRWVLLVVLCSGGGCASGSPASTGTSLAASAGGATAAVDFDREVFPILSRRCFACHGGVRRKSGLSLKTREDALAPADSGKAALVPGSPDHSELVARILTTDAEERMPPKDGPLAKSEIETVRRWVAAGAPWPSHWSLRRL